ncbi:protein-export chaperone SecB [Pelagibacteraceae bacterium]|nr:protein-export chaperone SecB [Pelagibacteraceae bacterium]
MSYKIIGKYIKHLDFRIPNSKAFSLLAKDISNYKINIDIKSNQVRENIVEVETTLKLMPLKKDLEIINTEILYSTIIEIEKQKIDKNKLEKIVLIDVPSEIYPDLRKIFVFIFENSGFKNIQINKSVDFQKLYDLRRVQ